MLEINEKWNILAPGKTVIDCGAAPGSWTEIAVEKTNANGNDKREPIGFVIGLDLLNIYPIKVSAVFVLYSFHSWHGKLNLNFVLFCSYKFQGAHVLGNSDFRLPETHEKVKKLLNGRNIDCVLSDMAPNATGVRALDQENITTLCYTVLRFAILMSSPNASLLVKLWDNGDVHKLEEDMLRYYKYVKHIKPNASRSESSEKFLLATEFYGLKSEE